MLGLLNRKTLKSMAMNLYHELVRGRIYEGKHFGLNADDISQRTGLSIHVAIALIHRLIDNELVESMVLRTMLAIEQRTFRAT